MFLVTVLVLQMLVQMSTAQTCVDRNSNCAGWAKTGECYNNPSYMECNCAASCRTPALCGGGDTTCMCLFEAKKGRCLDDSFALKCPDTCRLTNCNFTTSISSLEPRVAAAEQEITTLKGLVLDLQSTVIRLMNATQATPTTPATPPSPTPSVSGGGASYVRWGRTTCPSEATLVYKGLAGGSLYKHPGGAATTLCLPWTPEYANFTSTINDNSAFLYGAELVTEGRIPGFDQQDGEVPCAVCRSDSRSTTLMVPAKMSCYPGFHLEYWGYLMAGRYTQEASSDFVCVDKEPEISPSGKATLNGKLLFFVEGYCSSLPCPPYSPAKEITCAVCTK